MNGKNIPRGGFRPGISSVIVCSSVHTRIPAKTQSKGAAFLGEESAASLRRAGMQSNTGSEEHLETPILQYAGGVIAAKLDRTEKELVHGEMIIQAYFAYCNDFRLVNAFLKPLIIFFRKF